jgi:hypothetical protein
MQGPQQAWTLITRGKRDTLADDMLTSWLPKDILEECLELGNADTYKRASDYHPLFLNIYAKMCQRKTPVIIVLACWWQYGQVQVAFSAPLIVVLPC